MRILLDESLPKRLKGLLEGFVVKTVPEMGWQGKKNGELMKLLDGKFDIFLTADQNLLYQINLRHATVPVVVLEASSNRYQDLAGLIPQVLKLLNAPELKRVTRIKRV